MKRLTLFAALTLLLATPALAGTPDANAPDAEPAMLEASAADGQDTRLDIGAWLAAGTDRAMQEAVAQSGVQATSGCSASTICINGTRISCEGETFCFSEGACGIYCDTTGGIYCNPPFCP